MHAVETLAFNLHHFLLRTFLLPPHLPLPLLLLLLLPPQTLPPLISPAQRPRPRLCSALLPLHTDGTLNIVGRSSNPVPSLLTAAPSLLRSRTVLDRECLIVFIKDLLISKTRYCIPSSLGVLRATFRSTATFRRRCATSES